MGSNTKAHHNSTQKPWQLVSQFCWIQFKHCYRQANRCVDVLGRIGTDQDLDFISFNCPSVDIMNVFEEDLIGMYFNRLCLDPDVVL
ncbi:hypothetical protein SO802_002470 [Lithocarpus litseifolius]|uniref:RNase H type-1 domain-containing protein n=1 Tax=Lithocarpus litseifolius TaxID=425828 RepID=A0AAW2DY95_9ROSI